MLGAIIGDIVGSVYEWEQYQERRIFLYFRRIVFSRMIR